MDAEPRQSTGTSNVTVRGIALFLNEEELKDLHYALYITYGNDDSVASIWEKLRATCGPEMWARIVAGSGRPGMEDRDRARGFIEWLLSMDDPEDVIGRAERQTVTLTKIIDRARGCMPATDARASDEERG